MAPRGTPVLSADDGRIWRLRVGGIGGITVYATDPAQRFVYYYAHLDRYHPGLVEGAAIARGDTLGYVGNTGNAAATAPHLHFQVSALGDDRRYWGGTPVDPLPFLQEAEVALAAARTSAPATGALVADTVSADAPTLMTAAPAPLPPPPRARARP
jgi:murein DD-endopeptidase MepM/ murein hydrolase activator NlpD